MVGLGLASHRFLITVATGYLTSIVAYPYLPGPAPGIARPLIAFLLPTTAASIYGLLRRVWDRDLVRDRDETFESTCEAIVFAVVLFVIAIHVMVLAALTGALPTQRAWLVRGTIVLVGALTARVGNLLPRTRPNLAFGIRTPRTLANRGLWMQTHRTAGYVAVFLGAMFVMSGAFLPKQAIESVMGYSVASGAAFLVLSHYRSSTRAERS